MKMQKCRAFVMASCALLAVFAAGALHAEYNEISTDYPMTGPTTFTAATGVTNVYTGLISGSGPAIIEGGGTVVFSHPNNTYTGGTTINDAVFRLDANGCAGSGAITAAVDTAHIFVNCSMVPNDIRIEKNAGSSDLLKPGVYPGANQYLLFPMCDVTFEGNVEFVKYGRCYDCFNDSAAYRPTVTYKKGIKVGGNYLHLGIKGRMIFEDRFIVSNYAQGSLLGISYSDQGVIEFLASSNYLYLAALRNSNVYLKANDVFALTWIHYQYGGGAYGTTHLTGLQSILGISWDDPTMTDVIETSAGQCITSEDPATLRITGCEMSRLSTMSVDNMLVNKTAIFGKTTLLMDVDPAYTKQGFYQDFSVRQSTTTGDLVISNGDFRVSGTASFPNVPNIYVGAGGSFSNSSTKVSAFAGCKNLTVLGRMSCTGDATPFGYGAMALTLGSDAYFSLPVGATATVSSLRVGDTDFAEGRYGDGGTPLAQIKQGTVIVRKHDRYVDCVEGSDSNDGSEGHPFKTIGAATTTALRGDVIHVAPGTYGAAEGVQSATSKIGARVVVPSDVTLVSDAGAEKTIIMGAAATGNQIDNVTYGTGTNAVRCVYAYDGAIVRGFTLTGGRAIGADLKSMSDKDSFGSAFYSSTDCAATVEDCIVSNNAGCVGTIHQAVVRRCRVVGNVGLNPGSASAGYSCAWYGSIVDGNIGEATIMVPKYVESCTIGTNNRLDGNRAQVMYNTAGGVVNTLFCRADERFNGLVYATNCVFAMPADGSTYVKAENCANCLFGQSADNINIDSGYRPLSGSVLIDVGTNELSALSLADDFDIYGVPRALNGRIDVGAVEYDWRPTFSAELGRRIKIDYASPSVTTNADGGLLVVGGEVSGKVTFPGTYEMAFDITAGSLAVYVGGELVGESTGIGEQSVRFEVASVEDEVRFVVVEPVELILRKCSIARGLAIIFR